MQEEEIKEEELLEEEEQETEEVEEFESDNSSLEVPQNTNLTSILKKTLLKQYLPVILIGVTIFLVVVLLITFICLLDDSDTDNNNGLNGTNCSKISMLSTSLSRSDFISIVTNYLSSYSSETAKLFIDNAGLIYDTGKSIGANPEMVYVIAEKEQGWQDTDFTLRCNNFYGMGVYNGQNSGMCFETFKKGVEYELEYIKNKGTLDDLVKVYSYLGTYLANPGSWGDGGCIYLTREDIYGPNYSRCNKSYQCASSHGGPGCVLTTEAEKQAYIDWQAKIILERRKKIFNLDEDACEVTSGVEGSTEGTTFLNEPINTFLQSNNSSLEEFNQKVIQAGCKDKGTGLGVANVAATAVAELAKYGKKFHYTWGGMHVSTPPSNYGVLPSWGPVGPDCSGFVSWALYNAGFTWVSNGATGWGALGTVVPINDSRIEVGDFIVTPGSRGWNHIVIITGIHRSDGYYSTVEAASTNTGVVFNTVKISNAGSRKAVLMKDYYNRATKSDAFAAMCESLGG